MPIPNLSIQLIRFLVDTYPTIKEKYFYSIFSNYIRKTFTGLNENSNAEEVFNLVLNFNEKYLMELFEQLAYNDFKDFSKQFKSRLFVCICDELCIKEKEIKEFLKKLTSN